MGFNFIHKLLYVCNCVIMIECDLLTKFNILFNYDTELQNNFTRRLPYFKLVYYLSSMRIV